MIRLLFPRVILFALTCAFFVPASVFGQNNTRLFNLVGEKNAISEKDAGREKLSMAAVQGQPIQIHTDAIDSLRDTLIQIPVLDGKIYQAIQRETEGFTTYKTGAFSWSGKIYGEDGFVGDVVLSVYRNAMAGTIQTPTGLYEILPQAAGAHVLLQIDQSLFPSNDNDMIFPEATATDDVFGNASDLFGVKKSLGEKNAGVMPASLVVDNGSLIDVMILYTSNVVTALGGTTQANAVATQAVATTNTIYQNSGITPRIRLVRSQLTTYAETGDTTTDVGNIRSDATIAALRNTYGADNVALFTETAASGNCGVAYTMGNGSNTTAFAPNAFSVSKRSCVTSQYTFAHELGHNQGAQHNPENGSASASAVFTYAFGHYVNGKFGTVMSSASSPCTAPCPRIMYFSNPTINYLGDPTGTATRNNALTLNNTALATSQFRQSITTAATVSIGGRVMTTIGKGIQNVTITMTDPAGNVRTTTSTESGYYRFDEVEVGETYVLSVRGKRYTFNQTSQVMNINEETSGINFIAYSQKAFR